VVVGNILVALLTLKIRQMKCKQCSGELNTFRFSDITNMPINPSLFVCLNTECVLFGLLTIAGIPDLEDKLKIKHTKTND